MIPEWLQELTPYFIAVTGIASGAVVARVNKAGARENQIIDQVQEERNAMLQRLEAVEGKVETFEKRERALVLYVMTLQHWINEGKGPPPPDWPEEFVTDKGKE